MDNYLMDNEQFVCNLRQLIVVEYKSTICNLKS
jgi:hypothetical protein